MNKKVYVILIISVMVLLTTNALQLYNSYSIKGENVKRFYEINTVLKDEVIYKLENDYTKEDIKSWKTGFVFNKYHFSNIGLYSDRTKQMYSDINDIVWLLGKVKFGSEEDEKELLRLLKSFDKKEYLKLNDEFDIDNLNLNPIIEEKLKAIKWYYHFR